MAHAYASTLWRAGDKINIWHHYSAATGNVAKYCGREDGRAACVSVGRSSEDECEKLEPSAMRFIPLARSIAILIRLDDRRRRRSHHSLPMSQFYCRGERDLI